MIFDFRDCTLDDEACELRRDGEPVALQPRVLDVLIYLIRNHDRVVPKNELLDEIWAGVAVGDAVLTRAINLARGAVGDAGSDQAVIRTVPRKGYRFCAKVSARDTTARDRGEAQRLAEDAFAANDWEATLAALTDAEAEAALDARDFELRAWSLKWTAHYAEAYPAFERAHTLYLEDGEARDAARIALQLVRDYSLSNQTASAAGWLHRGVELLEDLPEGEEHAMLAWLKSRTHSNFLGNLEAGLEEADRAIEIARRVGSRNTEALGLLDRGHALLALGRVEEAAAIHDEVAAIAMSGALDVQTTGSIYCSVIWGCRNRGDWRRASEWTDRSTHWCESAQVAEFPGLCTLHRGEVLRLQARFEAAEREILRACDDLLISMPRIAGDAFNELGEIRFRRGDDSGAREAFRRAVELGMEPEPGLSRLRVEEGDAEGALKGLDRALADSRLNPSERRPLLLTAKIEAALACGQRDVAREALAALEAQPELWSSPAHTAEVTACRGRVLLAEGRPADAIRELQASRRGWLEIGAAYEAGRAQMVLAAALEADGDPGGARLEWEAAQDAFARVGAQREVQRVSRRLSRLTAAGEPGAEAARTVRTFLFTDIVDSTRLVELLGDAHWETLRRWHHRTLQAEFAEHGGEVVGPHEGDGFFVAFVDADAAIECAAAIQRTLAAHREQHGFAPQVRIGAHTAESLRRGGDYAGKGIHIAARVTSATGGDAISVTAETLAAAKRPHATGAPVPLDAEGVADPLEVAEIDWR